MSVKQAELGAELIETVCARVRDRVPHGEVEQCQAFVRQLYRWVPPEDLSGREPDDLLGAAVAHWQLMRERRPGETKVRVYTPERERDGWRSPYTVAELVTDDMPFVVDSVTMELSRAGYPLNLVIHPVMRVQRNRAGRVRAIVETDAAQNARGESVLRAEITREPDGERQQALRHDIERVLAEVAGAVEDWSRMRRRALELAAEQAERAEQAEQDEHGERTEQAERAEQAEQAEQFLHWLAKDHFTFLGYREYELVRDDDTTTLKALPQSGLGILRGPPRTPHTQLGRQAARLAHSPEPLVLTKANTRATIHRPAYLDYVGVKRFGPEGQVIGERRFLGLYTSAAYRETAREIPLLAGKVQRVLARAGFPQDSHDTKALIEILESYPRDALFQITPDELFDVAMGILALGERQRVRLFLRRDALDRFVECLVCIPRDRFNTENRERIAQVLVDSFGGTHVDWTLQLSESVLVRVHYIIHCPDGAPGDVDIAAVQERLVELTRAWSDELRDALVDEHGADVGLSLIKRYERAFPAAYRSEWAARSAVADIARIEELEGLDEPIISLYQAPEATEGLIRAKLYSATGVALSDLLPTFEHMGAKVVDERPYEISPRDREPVWIYDFGLRCVAEDVERVRDLFESAFLAVRRGELEDDGLNALILRAALSGREVTILRAVAKYLRQGGIPFSDAYIERTLIGHPRISVLLVRLFRARLDFEHRDPDLAERLGREIEAAIDEVKSLDEDRILRSFLSVVLAILRTNHCRRTRPADTRSCLAFKLDPSLVPLLPLPRPKIEVFVYSPQVEGVHLRGGKVARGGLRWSDRPEDFRTEVLGLMKAQMVKNALIVPVGSKGGFVVKRPPAEGGRDPLREEAVACYRTFLAGLLDLTDNIVDGDVVAPEEVVSYDRDDPYLVVAADKGTATFSDIANEVSARYGFWLGDAFASGGSHGYDHKQMGITARGAWESVKRHFRELGTDIATEPFTVIGIGDMSGDVFGNGMLLSRQIRLLAAFNHQHVFLDPDPDPEHSYRERERLFELSRSGWGDYDRSLISEGGGIFSRSAKSIRVSAEVREVLAIEAEELSPSELIRELLRAPVDLLWNGGIGTYVKASEESNADAGDKTNDPVRLNGGELRCRVVGEGGNLGFTQRGRVEYALAGGRINTDAIDNVAGVNCSDHEVNIKILLDSLVARGELDEQRRNGLLTEMTDAVGERVIYASYTQTQAMSLALAQAAPMIDVHARLIRHLEAVSDLNRELEALPDEDAIVQRKSDHGGLTAPELAVIMAYFKIHLYSELLHSDLPEDEHLAHDLERYFPAPLPERYAEAMRVHRLRREIIATVVANQLVDRAGITFGFRLWGETGASAPLLARGYAVAREVFDMRGFWSAVEELDNQVAAETQLDLLIEGRRLVERATRWLVRANPRTIDIAEAAARFVPAAEMLAKNLPELLDDDERQGFDTRARELAEAGVPRDLARRVAGMPAMLPTFDIAEVTEAIECPAQDVMRTYFRLGSRVQLNWLRDRIIALPRENRWQALARAALRDDLLGISRTLTQAVLSEAPPDADSDTAIDAWSEHNAAALQRSLGMIADIKAARIYDTTTLPVALRELRNLVTGDGGGSVGPSARSFSAG